MIRVSVLNGMNKPLPSVSDVIANVRIVCAPDLSGIKRLGI